MAEKQQKLEDSYQTDITDIKDKEEITTTQIEGSRFCFVNITLHLTFDCI